MPETLLPPPDPRHLWSDDYAHRPAPAPPEVPRGPGGGGPGQWPPVDRGPGRSRPPHRRGSLIAMLAVSALLGGGVSAGIVTATDDGAATRTTTVTQTANGRETAGSQASGAGLDAKALYAAASPGVVDITATGVSSGDAAPVSPFGGPQQPQSRSTATGTGFFVDEQGHIVTAAHVVDGASSITVRLEDGTSRRATLLGQDDSTDVAVLKIDPSGLDITALELADSSAVSVGDEVAAIGDPFGYARSISTGIVSGVDRTIEAPNGFTVAHAIQTDTAVNPGNSGGPLLDAEGRVVGIVDQIATGGAEQSSGVGFAVPIDVVSSSLETLKAGGRVQHAYLGVATTGATDATSSGATIGTVTPGGPAAAAGLRQGDVITKIGDVTVEQSGDVVAAVADRKPGDEVTLTVQRGGRTVELDVTLGTQPTQSTR